MTEEEWFGAVEPEPLLESPGVGVSRRKLRLFGVACCRSIAGLLQDTRSRRAVEVVEEYTEGLAGETEMGVAAIRAGAAFEDYRRRASGAGLLWASESLVLAASAVVSLPALESDLARIDYAFASVMAGVANQAAAATPDHAAESFSQVRFLHDIFGNPFRPVTLDRAWLTSDVLALARGIYDERAFDRMPILADALQDAGCTNDDLLSHCRDTSLTHVRGCWVVDSVLGKN